MNLNRNSNDFSYSSKILVIHLKILVIRYK